MQGGRFDQALGDDELVVDDVAQAPPAARPGIDEVHHFIDVGFGELRRLDVDRRGQADRGRLAQHADGVVQPGSIVAGSYVPAGIAAAVDDPALAVLLKVVGHGRAQQVGRPPDERVDVGQRRIHERRDENAGLVGALLVLVEVHERKPVLIEDLTDGPRLGQVEHEPVAVVVVAGIIMIEVRHIAALELGADVFLVPVHDHLLAVRVVGGAEKEDGVAEDFLGVVGSLARDEVVGQLHGHLGSPDLAGVEAAGDQHDGFAFLGQPGGLVRRKCAGVAQLLEDFAIAVELGQVFFRGDHGHDDGLLHGALADRQELEARRFLCQELEIGLDLVVIGQFGIRADFEAQEFFRRGLGGQGGRRH